MADRRIEDYAYQHGLSNNGAKRRLRAGADSREFRVGDMAQAHGGPVAGTGKPKKAK